MSSANESQVVSKTISIRKSTKLIVKRIGTSEEIIKAKIKEKRTTKIRLRAEETSTNPSNNEAVYTAPDLENQNAINRSLTVSTLHRTSESQRANKLRTQLKNLLQSVIQELTITGGRERRRITAKDVADAMERHASAVEKQ